jgi:hypothetical protein
MNHREAPFWWLSKSPSRLTTAKRRLNADSQRLLELFLQGYGVSDLASLYGVSDDAMACSLMAIVEHARQLVGLLPDHSVENN